MTEYMNVGIVKPSVSSYVWEIKNFCLSCKNIGDKLISPVFSTKHSTTEYKWLLQMLPKGDEESNKDWIWIYLKYFGESGDVNVNVTLSLLDDKCSKVVEHNFQKLHGKKPITEKYLLFEEHNFFTNKKNQVLVNDTINILCEIIHNSDLATPLKKICAEDNLPDYCRLQEFDKFEKLLEPENSTTDITFKIGKHEIKVHKVIIMSRSPVFQAMFERDMKEKEQGVVEITDIEFEIMKEVFRFVYVGKVNKIENIAGDLLIVADKYSIKGLKILCEKQLFENLTVSNAIDYLKLADTCDAPNLKSKIIKFILHNQKEIVHKPDFQLLGVEIVCEVLRTIVDHN